MSDSNDSEVENAADLTNTASKIKKTICEITTKVRTKKQ